MTDRVREMRSECGLGTKKLSCVTGADVLAARLVDDERAFSHKAAFSRETLLFLE